MKLRFITDWVSSSGLMRRKGDVREYPDGAAEILIRRKKAEEVVDRPYRPKPKKADP